jgi:hypothetical protein
VILLGNAIEEVHGQSRLIRLLYRLVIHNVKVLVCLLSTTCNLDISLVQSHAGHGGNPGRDGDSSDMSGSNPDSSYHEMSDGTTESSSLMEEDIFRQISPHYK